MQLLIVMLGFFVTSTISEAGELGDLRAGVVKIVSINKLEGKLRTGTGFIVRLEEEAIYIATAAHVIEGDSSPQVAFFPQANRFFPARTLGTEGSKDDGVAVLIMEGSTPAGLRSLVVSPVSTIPEGEEVVVIGFPVEANTPWVISKGVLAGRRGTDITFTGLVGEGNSGGPLLLHGHVLGIVTEMRAKVGYAVPMVTAKLALEGWGVPVEQSTYEKQATKSSSEALEKVKAELETLRKRDKKRTAELQSIKKQEHDRVFQDYQQRKKNLLRQIQDLENEKTQISIAGLSGEPSPQSYFSNQRRLRNLDQRINELMTELSELDQSNKSYKK